MLNLGSKAQNSSYQSRIQKNKTMKRSFISLLFLLILGFNAVKGFAQDWLPKNDDKKISIENLADELIRQNVAHWRVVLAQAIVESGWNFDSYLFRHSNNFIGMRIPYARESTRIATYKGYSVYASWQDCVKDIKLWQEHNWDGGSEEEYIALMHKIWSESPSYYRAVSSVIRRIDKMPPVAQRENLALLSGFLWQTTQL